jgi:hypothetical protein
MDAGEEALAHCHVTSLLSRYYQALDTHVITIADRTAHSTSHLQAVDTTTLAILANGFVDAEHVRTPEGWRIRRYKIDEHITDRDMEAFKKSLELEFE